MTHRTTLRARGQITLPLEVRKAAHLEEEDVLEIELTPNGILLRPCKLIDASQAWVWTPEWQEGLREALEDVKAGRVTHHASDEEFLRALDEASRETDADA
jgi:AbrB family looped-hinge helix DNA binding protein